MTVMQEAVTLRGQIDSLDEAIARLIAERASVSRSIQRQRILSGGARVDLSRESQILDSYSTSLGEGGKDIGLALLTYCRGDSDAIRDECQG